MLKFSPYFSIKSYQFFQNLLEIFQSTLDFFAPYKQKKIRYNNNPFMTKRMRKEIIIRSKLRNKFNKFAKL